MATRDVSVRISVMDGDKARREFTLTGEEGQKALEKIREATKPANDNLKLINTTVEEAKGAFENFAEHAGSAGRVLTALGPAGLIAAAAVGAIALAIHSAVDEAEKFNQAQRKLDAVLQATGFSAGQSKEQLTALAEGYAHTTLFTAEQVQQSEAILLTYKKIHSEIFDQALKATLDISTLFDRDLTASARAVGRALEDPVNGMSALTRAGVMLDPVMKANIKNLVETGQQAEAQKLLLDALAHSVGGQAEAQNQGLTGATHNFSESLKEMKIALGENIEESGTMQNILNGMAKAFQALREEIRPTAEEELKEVNARMQLIQGMGNDTFLFGMVDNPAFTQLAERKAKLQDQMAQQEKDKEDARAKERVAIAQEHAEALLGIEKSLNDKITKETQTEEEKILAETAAMKQKIQNELLPDKSNQSDIEKELALADKLKQVQLDKINEKEAEAAQKLADANQKVVDSLKERIKLESITDPRQQFIQTEIDKLNPSASKEQIDQTRQTAAAFYDLQQATKDATEAAQAHDKAVEKINQEMAHLKSNYQAAKEGIDAWREKTIEDLGGVTEANQHYIDIVDQIYNQKLKDAYYKSLQDSKNWEDGAIAGLHKYADEATNASKAASDVFSKAANDVNTALTDMATTGKFNMKSLASAVQSLEKDVLNSFFKQNVTGPIAGWFGNLLSGGGAPGGGDAGGGGIFGSIFSSIFHDGGVVGEGFSSTRAVPSLLFAGAPRFHDGLASDEFPAILQRGETVIPKNGRGGMNVIMNINTPNAQSF
ncbi:MAG: phage tail length tape measure family protein, partial [Pseudomonadota bacterium]|nr:phage tail length tape measure family protein [Pseudomonadota bacterium]